MGRYDIIISMAVEGRRKNSPKIFRSAFYASWEAPVAIIQVGGYDIMIRLSDRPCYIFVNHV